MNRTHAFLLIFVGILFGSLMTYAISSFVIGEDIFGQNRRVEQTDRFLDSVSKTVRQQRDRGGVQLLPVRYSCSNLGCLLSQGEMARVGMLDESICVWRQVDDSGLSPRLTTTTGPHFLDLTAGVSLDPESVMCRDVAGQAFFGQL